MVGLSGGWVISGVAARVGMESRASDWVLWLKDEGIGGRTRWKDGVRRGDCVHIAFLRKGWSV